MLRVYVKKEGTEVFEFPAIPAGVNGSIPDYHPKKSLVIFSCNPKDNGGMIQRIFDEPIMDAKPLSKDSLLQITAVDGGGEFEVIKDISAGETFELDITAKKGDVVTFKWVHEKGSL